jgi:bifunctional chitinase/lysozyme
LAASLAIAADVEPWSGQSGAGEFHVLFDGKVYVNRWWVEPHHCPADASPTNWSNPWQLEREATKEELATLYNPTSCDLSAISEEQSTQAESSNESETGDFVPGHQYKKGEVVFYGKNYYIATRDNKGSFYPDESSVWKEYTAVAPWDPQKAYVAGDRVIYDGVVYEARWWTMGEVPSEHISNGSDGNVWLLVDDYTPLDTSAVAEFDPERIYRDGEAMRYKEKIYLAKHDLFEAGITPETTNPWSVYIKWDGVKEKVGMSPGPWPNHFFAPYVDASLWYLPDFVGLKEQTGTSYYVLAFLVNTDGQTCSYSWGGVSSVTEGPSGLYERIKALRQSGGDVMISIGGANNNPIAKGCKDVNQLKEQYRNIIENFDLAALDFDIEGGHVRDTETIERRSEALRALQEELESEGRDVAIWFTLPVLPTGLTADGVEVVRNAFAHGVKLAGVNLMTMDYGGNMGCQSVDSEHNRLPVDNSECDIDATKAVFGQLKSLVKEFGLGYSDAKIWSMIGATPMIGVNDQELEVFFVEDAKKLRKHAESVGMGMLSMWSVARDRAAPESMEWQVSPTHSGLSADLAPDWAFSKEFALFDPSSYTGEEDTEDSQDEQITQQSVPVEQASEQSEESTPSDIDAAAEEESVAAAEEAEVEQAVEQTDDASASSSDIPPYVEGKPYQAGEKVQNGGAIYECKPWPYTGWCAGPAWAYEPGVGLYWDMAWIRK